MTYIITIGFCLITWWILFAILILRDAKNQKQTESNSPPPDPEEIEEVMSRLPRPKISE